MQDLQAGTRPASAGRGEERLCADREEERLCAGREEERLCAGGAHLRGVAQLLALPLGGVDGAHAAARGVVMQEGGQPFVVQVHPAGAAYGGVRRARPAAAAQCSRLQLTGGGRGGRKAGAAAHQLCSPEAFVISTR